MFPLVTNAYAAGGAGQPGMMAQIIPLVLIIVVFYLFLILPQQKQRKKHREFIESLQRGDKVITSSGIYGTITKVNEKDFVIEIAEGVNIKILKDNIISKY
jgi:preprotein translocase subunit YajC